MIRSRRSSTIPSLSASAAAAKRVMSSQPAGRVYFGPFEVTSHVFLRTPHSFALVNLKPLLPGHVLVCPLKPHLRLTDLTAPELTDLFQAVQRVQRMLARYYFTAPGPASPDTSEPNPRFRAPRPGSTDAGAFNIAIQDGADAGQTVSHVHVHIIPRIRGATAKAAGPGDQIYESMASEEGNIGGSLWDREFKKLREQIGDRPVPGGGFPMIEDAERHPRSAEAMETEAKMFRSVLEQMGEGDESI
ncbi:HIT-like protein [Durotheca rogersii]|uniref:HIT-like protein n=1 Tax=Durotheca rogersii TaxID=419775 RepID=UPI0022207C3C|nr:HIT-like protein [Durotheca rogersii]KAI5867020.1 HIT-like protein [Durotheca rogersii]